MQIITKNIQWRAVMETYQTAKFDHSLKNLFIRCPEEKERKEEKIITRKAETIDLHI